MLCATELSPDCVTVKVKAVVPLLPSAFTASAASIETEASSLRMVPLADAVPMVSPADGLDSVTVKPSSASTVVSPATRTVIVFEDWQTAEEGVPEGNTPPAKSDPLAGAPPEPATL